MDEPKVMRRKTKGRPLAPVDQTEYRASDNKRRWIWQGDVIASQGLLPGCFYTTDEIKAAGFRLPKLKKYS